MSVPNKATGNSPIPAYMHPAAARYLLNVSRARRMVALARREADRANIKRMEGGK